MRQTPLSFHLENVRFEESTKFKVKNIVQWTIVEPSTLLSVHSVQIHLHPPPHHHPITVATCETEINYQLTTDLCFLAPGIYCHSTQAEMAV